MRSAVKPACYLTRAAARPHSLGAIQTAIDPFGASADISSATSFRHAGGPISRTGGRPDCG
ncbi:MAG: hypothetical protein MZV70_05275 [Desulfobacterales bacterium]|nr:hypothetical protein [Desulfobacterales bacterium]